MTNQFPISKDDIFKIISLETSKMRLTGVWGVYTRLSRLDPRQPGYSMETQPDRAVEFAKAHGAREIKIFEDPDRSGKNSKRDGLQQMIREAKAGRLDVLVFHRIDRLFRNLESLLELVKLLKKNQIKIYSVLENIDTDTWWGRLVMVILGSLAEAYVWQVSENTRGGLDRRRLHGLHLGRIPLGYCNGLCSTCNDENGKDYCPLFGGPDRVESQRGRIAVPHPVDRHGIRLIMDLSKSGMSDREVANFLNNNLVTLPDGSEMIFRPRGKRGNYGKNPPRFTRESIRAILENPFYSGQVARYHRPKFNMEDDLEYPENIPAPKIEGNSREILELYKGQHEPLFSFETWSAIQSLRKQRSTTPTVSNKTVRIYPLSGIGRCWECFEEIGQEFTLRGSPGGKGFMYYRCAYTHDQALKRKPKIQPRLEGINPVVQTLDHSLVKRHKSLRAEKLEAQVDALVSKLFVPKEWDDWISAFYLSDDGMAEFERAGYGYRQELKNLHKLFEAEQVSRPEFERKVRTLHYKLKSLGPASNPEASRMLVGYRSFGNIWTQLDNGEKRIFLSRIFDSLFFDREGRLIRVVAYEPFRRLLNLPEDGMIVEL